MLAMMAGSAARAADSPGAGLEQILVVGSTPLAGSDLDRDRVPAASQVLGSQDINRTGIPDLTGAILSGIPSATLNDVEGNPFQPDILFRGFTASPAAGTPQGLAVYVNGARFNDAFGDTVNWDLIPPTAIETVGIEASNPVFGLNALGGSLSVQLKNGFSEQGTQLTSLAGAYGRRAAIVQTSGRRDAFAFYFSGDVTHDDGFRQTGASDLYRGFADLGWRDGPAELHLALTAAHDRLGNPGATPEQALAVDISNIFTAPNYVDNRYASVNLNGAEKIADGISMQGAVYFQSFRQYIPNGITSAVTPCADGRGLLCNSDGTPVTTTGEQAVSDFLNGGSYSGLSLQRLNSHAYGATIQATDERPRSAGGLDPHLVVGIAFDGSASTYSGIEELGGFNPYSREFIGPGIVIDQPDEGVNPVRVRSHTRFYGLFVSEAFPVSPDLGFSVSGRFNEARIDLADELGGPVNGQHAYHRFNPSAGLTYRVASWAQLYGSYSETNRVPTPQELSCASAAYPCSLLNFFVGDPDLNQVVAHTAEAGVRGRLADGDGSQFTWNVGYYHAENTDDIIYESTAANPNLAYYTNAGRTLRQGIEVNTTYDWRRLHMKLGYAYTDATFRTPLDVNSPDNPAASVSGQTQVVAGDRVPGIPRHRSNLIIDYVAERWTLGAEAVVQSSAYRFGDDANLTSPIGGYMVLDLNAAYRPTDHLTAFAVVNNLLDKRYAAYGSFGPIGDVPWPNVHGGVTDPRTSSPGMPVAVYGGVRVTF